jgi:hypothetical protein
MVGRKMARRFHDVSGFAGELKGGVVAIGNFDGMHRGHQAVLARAMEKAAEPWRTGIRSDLSSRIHARCSAPINRCSGSRPRR